MQLSGSGGIAQIPIIGGELVKQWEAAIWDTSGGTDELAQPVGTAVAEIEALCRPALAANVAVDGSNRWWQRLVK